MSAVRVHECAFPQQIDIDPTEEVDAAKLDSLGKTCMVRAKDALNRPCPGYSDLQRFAISEVFSSLMSTHQTIRKMLGDKFERSESVNALVLTRVQLEGLFAVCLMLEAPAWVDSYLRDGWRKLYTSFLLQREETKNLSKFDHYNQTDAPPGLEKLRKLYGITEAQKDSLERDELGVPLPSGVTCSQIEQFPTPGKIIRKITVNERMRMLKRLYPEYVRLSSFAHGLPQANLFKGMFGQRTIHSRMFSESQLDDTFQDQVVEESFLLSFLSSIQSAAELSALYPGDVELRAAVTEAWQYVSRGTFLGRAMWEIRTKQLLGSIS